MNRREVLKAIALSAPLTVGGRLYAAPWTSTRLLVVFLRGAYDAANVVVPVSSDFYYQSRPTLAIAKPNPKDPNAALPLDRDWALHPALRETLYPLYQNRNRAVRFRERLDRQHYPVGAEPTSKQLESLRLNRHEILPKWNYTISPNM